MIKLSDKVDLFFMNNFQYFLLPDFICFDGKCFYDFSLRFLT